MRLTDELSQLRLSNNSLSQKETTLEAEISIKDATILEKVSELAAKTEALEENRAIISGLSEQLTRVRERLSSNQQVRVMS